MSTVWAIEARRSAPEKFQVHNPIPVLCNDVNYIAKPGKENLMRSLVGATAFAAM